MRRLVFAAVFLAAGCAHAGVRPPPPSPIPLEGAASRGAATAAVDIVVFGDLQCPFCARLWPTLDELSHDPDVRLVWKHMPLPFHAHARELARVGLACGVRFFDFAAWVFAHQRDLDGADLAAWAAQAQCPAGPVRKALSDPAEIQRLDAAIDADAALAAKLGASGTPTTFVNGVLIAGAQPKDRFTSELDRQRRLAAAMADAGAPADEIAGRLTAAQYLPPQERRGPEREAAREPARPHPRSIPLAGSPSRGAKAGAALVTIVEFSDFQCPFCRRVQPTLTRLLAAHPEVRVVYKHNPLPFHPEAMPAALASTLAGDDTRFWALHDAFYGGDNLASDDVLEADLQKAGLDPRLARQAAGDPAAKRRVDDDLQLARDVGASGTPTFFLNCVELVGAQPYERFEQVVGEQLAIARTVQKETGATGDALYDKVCAENAKR